MPDVSPTAAPEMETLAEAQARAARAEQAAAEAIDARCIFLEAVEHEFRTAMTGVLAVADLLSRAALPAEGRSLVQALAGSALAAQRLIDDALELSCAGDLDSAELDAAPFRPSELLDAVETLVEPRTRERSVRLVLSHDGDPELRLVGDAQRLTRALRAFVEQAVERSRGGLVEAQLAVRESGGEARVEARIRDCAPAPEEPTMARLFEPGVAGGAGSGLRLPIARRLIHAMHGAVWAESNAGSGLTLGFDLMLPVAAEETSDEPAPSGVFGARVLIVDDNATNRLVATAFCEIAGCLCETAEDGDEAVEAVKARSFDLVLMDIRMPRMDGLAATRAIRALPGPERNVPILALTADADVEAARLYRAAGMLDVVEKPIKPEKLLTAIQSALGGEGRSGAEAVAA